MRQHFNFILIITIGIIAGNCNHSVAKFQFVDAQADSSIKAKQISIDQLTRQYKQLDGQYIQTEGIFFLASEEFAIYTDKKLLSNNRDGFWMETKGHLIPDSA